MAADTAIDPQCRGILKEAVIAALARHTVRTANVCISIVDDSRIEKLNQQHLGHQGPTDVLTYDLSESDGKVGKPDSISERRMDGEIVISRDTARREAELRRHPIEAELALYVVHGVLHLLGYDDRDDACSTAMHAMEDEILASIGVGAVFARAPIPSDHGTHSAAAKNT